MENAGLESSYANVNKFWNKVQSALYDSNILLTKISLYLIPFYNITSLSFPTKTSSTSILKDHTIQFSVITTIETAKFATKQTNQISLPTY